jgi:hypothetical protein
LNRRKPSQSSESLVQKTRDAWSDSLSNEKIQINKETKGLSENSDLQWEKADQGSKDVRTFSGYMIVGHRWARSKTPMNKNKYPSRRKLGNPHETPNEPHDLVTIALSLISQFGYVLINFFRPPSMKHQWSTKGWESPTTSWEKVSTRQGA